MTEQLLRTDGVQSPYNGTSYVPVRWPVPVTKWDLLGDAARAAYERMTIHADGGPVLCAGCAEVLVTEADFARHFVIPDLRYWNVGDCPNQP